MADSLHYPDNYSVLFVIQGNSYEGFMNEVLNIDYVEDRYYTIMDPEYEFLEANKDMTQLFYACANSQAGDAEGAEAARLSHLAPSTTEVGVVQVVRGDFELELISNGKLEAQRRAVVPFAVQEQILSVSVRHHFQSACQGFQSIFSLCLLSEILDVDAMHLVLYELETETA